jgi:HK97 family phage prohead protease
MPSVLEIESLPGGVIRMLARDGARGPMLTGTAIVFHSLSEDLGGFRERILPSAIERTLNEKIDLRALVDHDSAKVLGRLTARPPTLRLTADAKGLHVEIDPPETSYAQDLLASVGRGDVDGMSFAFRTVKDDVHLEDGQVVRDVLDMRIHEVSVVTFPAYRATGVEVARRSVDAFLARPAVYRPSLAMLRNRQRQSGVR